MNTAALRVGIDVGSTRDYVAVGLPDGKIIDEFNVGHHTTDQWFEKLISFPCMQAAH